MILCFNITIGLNPVNKTKTKAKHPFCCAPVGLQVVQAGITIALANKYVFKEQQGTVITSTL